jgi:hypothetical protein
MKLPSLSRDEWASVLTWATRWRFLRVREMAKSVLERYSLTSFKKISLGRKLYIPSWVIDGYVQLVQATTITNNVALQIDSGAETTAYELFRIRELRFAMKLSCSTETKVEEIFKKELDRLRSMEKMFSDFSNYNEKLAKKKI